jgi:hypothetical protein
VIASSGAIGVASLSGARRGIKVSCAVRESEVGPGLPTYALQQVGSYLGYTGRAANVATKAAHDPQLTCVALSPRRSASKWLNPKGRSAVELNDRITPLSSITTIASGMVAKIDCTSPLGFS